MKVISIVLLIVGALISYLSKIIITKVLKREVNDTINVYVKLSGFLLVLASVVITILS